ncbi:MAG: GSCFA domain-containing protein [Desulfuromonadia bacterium]
MHPYQDLPDHHFWRKAITLTETHAVDPVIEPRFRVRRDDRIATAGSCFAQHIAKRLRKMGVNYFVPESGEWLLPEERRRRGYGVYSARYGNIYTAGQLWQLFEEAMGSRPKSEQPWLRSDGRYVDPFRPLVEPDGFATPDDVMAARVEHLDYVRRVFCESDLFIFTLGLTESWVSVTSGDIFPLAPGVAAGTYDPESYSFVNNTVGDVVQHLGNFLRGIREVNPTVRVLLTVSPVPMIATYENRHVLVSTIYCKSVLRVAADMMLKEFDWVDYFPGYEISVGNFSLGAYYEDNLRAVRDIGVSHVMRCFMKHYLSVESDSPVGDDAQKHRGVLPTDDGSESDDVICDEMMIEKVSF